MRKQDFLSQEPLKQAAREVTLLLAPRQGGKSAATADLDRVSGKVRFQWKSLKGPRLKKSAAAKKVSSSKKPHWSGAPKSLHRLVGR